MPRSSFEIIVVDNTPEADRQSVGWDVYGVDKVVIEPLAGLSRARNAGIASSEGEFIVFIDDDAEAKPDWLSELIAAFDNAPRALAVGGKVTAKYVEGERPEWLSDKTEGFLSCIDWKSDLAPLRAGQWIVGANMAFKKGVFDKFGLFNVSLGRIGHGTLLSNEESALLGQIGEASVYYCGRSEVDHLIPPERTQQEWFRKRAYWQAISDLLSGKYSQKDAPYHLDQFIASCVNCPAEHRSLRALDYQCDTPEEFDDQLGRVYSMAVAAGFGFSREPGAGFRKDSE